MAKLASFFSHSAASDLVSLRSVVWSDKRRLARFSTKGEICMWGVSFGFNATRALPLC
jgi:hypothetical protein